MNKIKIKKGDQVIVIAGVHKGTKGSVLKVLYTSNKALVEGVNTVKRHTKPSSENPKGGIIEKLLPINISNLSLMTKDGEKTRVGYKIEDGKKVRISIKSKEII
jgi:large subunit ribosomal protein L24|tara:strand:- start:1554 stop:1865 length:312 start_codon:yes stop_codon:yes gene_type:complete